MLRIFNTNSLSQNERFYKALTFGITTTIGITIIFTVIQRLLGFRLSIVYLLIGYLISFIIRKYGRGVQPRFAYLGAALTFIAILFADLFTYYGFYLILNPELLLSGSLIIIRSWLNPNLNNILGLLFRLYAIYYAYTNSRIV